MEQKEEASMEHWSRWSKKRSVGRDKDESIERRGREKVNRKLNSKQKYIRMIIIRSKKGKGKGKKAVLKTKMQKERYNS